jgi:hypothetical protein
MLFFLILVLRSIESWSSEPLETELLDVEGEEEGSEASEELL